MTDLDADAGGFLAAVRSLQKTPPAVAHLIDSVPEFLDMIRRVATRDSFADYIDLQREANLLLARLNFPDSRERDVERGAPRFVAGPRAKVYRAVPGARLTGEAGQAAHVFKGIERAGVVGMTSKELREELRLKPKSLESVLYRLRLAGLIRGYDAREVRG